MHALEKMAHTTRNLDILLESAKTDPMVTAHMHTTNKETAGERLKMQSYIVPFFTGPGFIHCVR